jgi:peptidoglycan/LPS O-acetylase OafA/YrhL
VYHSWLYSTPEGPIQRSPVGLVAPDLAFGVILFFTLSGFLLYRPYAAAALRRKALPSTSTYLRNRALRILPAYVVIVLLVAFVLRAALVHSGNGTGALTDPDLLLRNLLLVQSYHPETLLTGIGPAWSLGVEVVFYLALPALGLIGWVLARRARSRSWRRAALFAPAVLMLGLGAAGKLVAAHAFEPGLFHGWQSDWQSVVERSFWCQADLFAFGMALAVLRIDVEDGFSELARRLRPAAIPFGVAAYVATAVATGTSQQLGFSFYNTLMAFAFACLLALVVIPTRSGRPSALLRLLEFRPVVWLGLISYSLFLWHEPLVRWLETHGLTRGGIAGLGLNTVVLLTLAVALSFVTYRWVELPALRRKARARAARKSLDIPPEQFEAAP